MEQLIYSIKTDMWQQITIIIIAVLIAGIAGCKLRRYFKKPPSPCDDCTGCSLKESTKNPGNPTGAGTRAKCPESAENTACPPETT